MTEQEKAYIDALSRLVASTMALAFGMAVMAYVRIEIERRLAELEKEN